MKVRCNECDNKRLLLGNEVNCMCAISGQVEPLYEILVCGDFKKAPTEREKKQSRRK